MKLVNHFNQPVVKKHLSITILGIALGLLVFYYVMRDTIQSQVSTIAINGIVYLSFSGILTAYITYFISNKLDKLISWQTQLTNRFVLGILSTSVVLFVVLAALLYLFSFIFKLQELQQSVFLKLGIIVFVVMLLYNIIYFAFYSYHAYNRLQIDAVAYERKQIDLQLKALKSQLSSHFLFNNLNTISSLASKDDDLTESYTRGLASIYHYTLNSYHKKLVDLKEELKYVDDYILLLKTRFGNAINYSVSLSENIATTKIPPLTLQMLIENAVKHNQIDSRNNLEIQITGNKDSILVRNNITKTPGNVQSFNIGLKNIAARYKLLNSATVNITKDTHFTVKLPIINS